ncbi:YbaB/EbfC family nucleoid-associated protein [Nonomuraea sp. NPDC000554]|uniref:YbaB/EbfC family nucleoid-associated protein n=1 Tax=Nonomuraea sp. NPDC000554 TaxID=3154259 RepID=UPI00331E132B
MRPSSASEDREYLEDLLEQASGLLRSMAEAQARLNGVTGEGVGPEGVAHVVADRGGRIQQITLLPRSMRLTAEVLSGEVLSAAQNAQQDAEEQSARILSDVQARADAVPDPLDETFVQARLEQVLRDL